VSRVLVPVLALSWAALLAAPFAARARRVASLQRVGSLTVGRTGRSAEPAGVLRFRPGRSLVTRICVGARERGVVLVLTAPFARRRSARAAAALTRDLPVTIDLLAVAVGSGCTPFLAVEHAARLAPPAIAPSLEGVVRSCRLGAAFGEAWRDVAARTPQLAPLAEALTAGERTGARVGPALGRLAAEERAAARRRVESHARRVPVRLLFPLVFLVLPAFVVLTVVPGLAAGLARL
jgi:tight adherence protein C